MLDHQFMSNKLSSISIQFYYILFIKLSRILLIIKFFLFIVFIVKIRMISNRFRFFEKFVIKLWFELWLWSNITDIDRYLIKERGKNESIYVFKFQLQSYAKNDLTFGKIYGILNILKRLFIYFIIIIIIMPEEFERERKNLKKWRFIWKIFIIYLLNIKWIDNFECYFFISLMIE